jgi:hypothetical protein
VVVHDGAVFTVLIIHRTIAQEVLHLVRFSVFLMHVLLVLLVYFKELFCVHGSVEFNCVLMGCLRILLLGYFISLKLLQVIPEVVRLLTILCVLACLDIFTFLLLFDLFLDWLFGWY